MWLLAPFRLVARTVRRFHDERCAQTAAALSFATLLGLVPMIAVGFALISLLPAGAGLGAAIEKFLLANLLPDKAGAIIAKYVGLFAQRAGRVTLIGIAVLAVTALMQMLTIEHAFNHIWRIKAQRPLLRRVVMHGVALALGPLVFGASLVAISFVASVSLGFVNEPAWINQAVIRGVPFVFMVGVFGLLYWAVPNRPVRPLHAAFGGLMAALGFAGMQKLFTYYIASFTLNAVVYGAFSVIPVFLVWLYVSWGVILVGALLVAELPGAASSGR